MDDDRSIEHRLTRVETRVEEIKDSIDRQLTALEKAMGAAFAAHKEAVLKAEEAQRELNVKNNEFRQQLDAQARSFLPRLEFQAILKGIDDRNDHMRQQVQSLFESRSEGSGKASGAYLVWTIGIAVVGLLFSLTTIAVMLLKK